MSGLGAVNDSRPVYRITVTATAADPQQRLACIPPARSALRSAAEGWGVAAGTLDDLTVIAGELIANAALHTGPARLPVRLLAPSENTLRVEVDDPSSALPREVTALGDDQAVTGRGMLMVGALAKAWGATVTTDGKTVWAEIGLPAAIDSASVARTTLRDRASADWRAAARMGTDPSSAPTFRPAGTAPSVVGPYSVLHRTVPLT